MVFELTPISRIGSNYYNKKLILKSAKQFHTYELSQRYPLKASTFLSDKHNVK